MTMTQTATIHAQQRWEYMEVTAKSEGYLIQDLNEAGQQGWELISMIHGKDRKGDVAWTAFLKRPYITQNAPSPS